MADCLISRDLMPVLLSDLQIGDSARVTGYTEQSAYASQLMCLGLIPGTLHGLSKLTFQFMAF